MLFFRFPPHLLTGEMETAESGAGVGDGLSNMAQRGAACTVSLAPPLVRGWTGTEGPLPGVGVSGEEGGGSSEEGGRRRERHT